MLRRRYHLVVLCLALLLAGCSAAPPVTPARTVLSTPHSDPTLVAPALTPTRPLVDTPTPLVALHTSTAAALLTSPAVLPAISTSTRIPQPTPTAPTATPTLASLPHLSMLMFYPGFSIAYSADGQFLAVGGGSDDEIDLIDRNSGLVKWRFQAPDIDLPRPDSHWGKAVAFSPDGSRVAFGGTEEQIYLLDARTGLLLGQRPHHDLITNVAFSSDGEWLVASGCLENPGLTAWNLKTGSISRYHISACFSVASPTEASIAIRGVAPSAQILDLACGRLTTLPPYQDGGFALAFSPDGKTLAGDVSDSVRFVDSVTGDVRTLAELTGSVGGAYWVSWSSNNRLAIAHGDGSIVVLNASTGKMIGTWASGQPDIRSMVWSPDGTELATVTPNGVSIWIVPSE